MKSNQKGFSLVEIMLVIIAVALVAGVGAYVYNMQQDKKDDSSVNTSTSQTTATTDTTTDKTKIDATEVAYIELKELGVKIKKTSDLDGIEFSKFLRGNESRYSATTSEYAKTVAQCNGTDYNPSEKGSPVSLVKETGDSTKKDTLPGEVLKQFEDYYIIAYYPNGLVCQDEALAKIASDEGPKIISKVREAFKTAEQL